MTKQAALHDAGKLQSSYGNYNTCRFRRLMHILQQLGVTSHLTKYHTEHQLAIPPLVQRWKPCWVTNNAHLSFNETLVCSPLQQIETAYSGFNRSFINSSKHAVRSRPRCSYARERDLSRTAESLRRGNPRWTEVGGVARRLTRDCGARTNELGLEGLR